MIFNRKINFLFLFVIFNFTFNSSAEEDASINVGENQLEIDIVTEPTEVQLKLVEKHVTPEAEDIEDSTEESLSNELEETRKQLEAEQNAKKAALSAQADAESQLIEMASRNSSLIQDANDAKQIIQNEKKEEQMIYLISGLLGLTLIISLILILSLLKWRLSIRDKDNQISIVPHELLKELGSQQEKLQSFLKKTDHYQKDNASSNRELIEIISTFRESIEEKENELKRWKKGYDLEIFKQFLIRFIDANEALDDAIQSLNGNQNDEFILELKDAKELLEYALKQTGLESFSPSIGDDIRDAFGIDEQYRTEPTKDPNKVMTIAEVRKPGYLVRNPETNVCIIPAKIVVYVVDQELEKMQDQQIEKIKEEAVEHFNESIKDLENED